MADLKKYRVPKSAITEKGLKKLIKEAAKPHSSIGDWAVSNDVTPQAVSAFFRKTQGAGLKIPEVLGYRPQLIYLPLDEDPIQEPPAPRRVAQKPTKKVDHTKKTVERSGHSSKSDRDQVKEDLKKRKRNKS